MTKVAAAAAVVVASLVLVVCAVDETQWERAPGVNPATTHHTGTGGTSLLTTHHTGMTTHHTGGTGGTSLLTKLRSAVKQIELLADEVDATLSIADNDHNAADSYNWMPPAASSQMLKCFLLILRVRT